MWNELILDAHSIYQLFIGIVIISAHLTLTKKQSLTQFTSIDFIGNFVLGGIIGGIIYNHTVSTFSYVVLLLATVGMISLFNLIASRFMPARQIFKGKAVTIINHGHFVIDSLDDERSNFDIINFTEELRSRGIFSVEDIEFAQYGSNGSLTVVKKGDGSLSYVLVSKGQVVQDQLEASGQSKEWLTKELEQQGIKLEDIFFAQLLGREKLYVVMNDMTARSFTFSLENSQENAEQKMD